MELLKRREEIVADHKAMEKHHPHFKAAAAAGERLSEQPVAFLCDDEVVLVGPCVGKVLDGLRAFVERFGAAHDENVGQLEYYKRHALVKARKVLAASPDKEIRVPQQTWNALTHCLEEIGVRCVLTDGTFGGGDV